MIGELGTAALSLALIVALLQAALPVVAGWRGHRERLRLATPLAVAQFALVATAFGALVAGFVASDFSLAAVAAHSQRALPLARRIAAAWAGHEGSLLLWAALLSGWSLAFALVAGGRLPREFTARTLAVLAAVSAGFLLLVVQTANPFVMTPDPPADGRDLQPLLQHWAMSLHPPLLFAGYAALALPFALAVAALLGRDDEDGGGLGAGIAFARRVRPWATLAWSLLTAGIALGSLWAYEVLGWGGWWFWDPVENASLLPWLAATMLLHALAATARRGTFAAWSVLLAIGAFALALLGTFIVRSGVLASVHAFARDPARGAALLALVALAVGGALAVYARRAGRFSLHPVAAIGAGAGARPAPPRFAPLSREALLLGNNLLLGCAAAAVLLGTLYPLLVDALDLAPAVVGPRYFERVLLPLFALLALPLGVATLVRWRRDAAGRVAASLHLPLALLPLGALAAAAFAGRIGGASALGLGMAWWIAAGVGADLLARLRGGGSDALARVPLASWGVWLAHLGVALFAFAVALSGGEQRETTLAPGGAPAELAGYRFALHGFRYAGGPNHDGLQALIEVRRARDDRREAWLKPEKRRYRTRALSTTEVAIDRNALRDLQVSLGEPLPGGAWTVRLQVRPFVVWIWVACGAMAAGGLLALLGLRGRVALGQPAASASAAPAAAPSDEATQPVATTTAT